MGSASATVRAGKGQARSAKKGAVKTATVTVGELRTNFKAVEAKLAKGVRVQVTRRGAVVAEVQAPAGVDSLPEDTSAGEFANFLVERKKKLRALWGGPQDVDTTAMVSEGRDRDFLR
jgi:antitoxin (DNA-binding transcriptional repressor) of toxin-antitoxin stability system